MQQIRMKRNGMFGSPQLQHIEGYVVDRYHLKTEFEDAIYYRWICDDKRFRSRAYFCKDDIKNYGSDYGTWVNKDKLS